MIYDLETIENAVVLLFTAFIAFVFIYAMNHSDDD